MRRWGRRDGSGRCSRRCGGRGRSARVLEVGRAVRQNAPGRGEPAAGGDPEVGRSGVSGCLRIPRRSGLHPAGSSIHELSTGVRPANERKDRLRATMGIIVLYRQGPEDRKLPRQPGWRRWRTAPVPAAGGDDAKRSASGPRLCCNRRVAPASKPIRSTTHPKTRR